MSQKSKLEYIWLDGYKPTQYLRSKTRIERDFSGNVEDCPIWSFDGSSTKQANINDWRSPICKPRELGLGLPDCIFLPDGGAIGCCCCRINEECCSGRSNTPRID